MGRVIRGGKVGAFVNWRMSRSARARAKAILPPMLDAGSTQPPGAAHPQALQDAPAHAAQDAQPSAQAVRALLELIERIQAELQFEKIRNQALNLEVARLKNWRFGKSSESLDGSTQAVLFDAIAADTTIPARTVSKWRAQIRRSRQIPG